MPSTRSGGFAALGAAEHRLAASAPPPVPPRPDLAGWEQSACSARPAAASVVQKRGSTRIGRPAQPHQHAGQKGVASSSAAARPFEARVKRQGKGRSVGHRGRPRWRPSRWLISGLRPLQGIHPIALGGSACRASRRRLGEAGSPRDRGCSFRAQPLGGRQQRYRGASSWPSSRRWASRQGFTPTA